MAKHPIDRDAPASVIAAKFGGMYRLAKAMNKAPGTVHRWLVKGYIPGEYQPEILALAKGLKVKISPADFVDTRPVSAVA